VKKRSTYIL